MNNLNKYFVLLLILTFCTYAAFSQKRTDLYLWPNAVPGLSSAKIPATVKYDSSKKIIRVTEVNDPLLEVFPAPSKNNNGAAIVICPGGGYKFLAFDLEGEEIARWLNTLGYNAFVLQYRVPNNQKAALQDAQRALRIVRSHAAAMKIDTSKIGIMGFSAGGNLAARASTNFDSTMYAPVDVLDSLSARPAFSLYIYPGSLGQGPGHHELIPELPVTSKVPPAFFFVANDDQYNIAFPYASALHDAKVSIEMHVVPKGGHGYGLRAGNPAAEVWPGLAKKWLDYTLKTSVSK